MLNLLKNSPKTVTLFILVIISLALNVYANDLLNTWYKNSLFPVPYFEAQLSFSADKLQSWYAFLIENNSFEIYLKTQYIDFLFIATVLFLHFFVLLLISRLFSTESKVRRILIICALLSTIAPIADVIENLISFVMLANPTNFSDDLAIIYSSFAAIKFAMFTFTYIVAALAILFGLFLHIRQYLTDKKPLKTS